MKILVCIKAVPEKEARLLINEDQTWIREQDITFDVNECDLYALEEALRVKEKHGGEVVAISLGDEPAAKALKDALARGADRAVHLKDPAFRGTDPFTVARALAKAVEKDNGYDLVFAGMQSDDLAAGQTGIILAEFLGLPHATMVVGLEVDAQSCKARVTRELEAGLLEIVEVPVPALLAIQFGINQPRYASLKGIMQAKKKEVKVWSAQDLGLKPEEVGRAGSQIEISKIFLPEQKRKVEIIDGSPDEAAAKLLEKLRKEAKVI